MFYINWCVNVVGLQGVEWVYGIFISIVIFKNGWEWDYLQDVQFNGNGVIEMLWVFDVFVYNDQYYMYLIMVLGIFDNWLYLCIIVYFISVDLLIWMY